ncbi:hypothetical protein CTA2_3343 [Colletotrichum tanaceti]|nr:hypothetical protein CTA2_3343 [Colletotrichum tanaceti]
MIERNPQWNGDGAAAAAAAGNLVNLLEPLLADAAGSSESPATVSARSSSRRREILSAIQHLTSALDPGSPLFAAFHDGQVHDPLGAGSYAFQNDIVGPVLSALVHDECLSSGKGLADVTNNDNDANSTSKEGDSSTGASARARLPTRPIVIHAGLQPNNSPHAGTLVVFCFAFAVARGIRDRIGAAVTVSVEITFIDTAPVKEQGVELDDVQYQRSYRDVPEALQTNMGDYDEVLHLLSTWSGIPFAVNFQADLFSHPTIPSILGYIIRHHKLLGHQLSPKYGTLAIRAACPAPGCWLAEKHGRHNVYKPAAAAQDATITFRCPVHGPHTISISEPADVARLEANAPVRNLIRSMSHLLDTATHHVRVTGADYAGMYQEVFLYRPLATWSAVTGLAAGRTPHILYAPLITDWSGAKLSKALYIRERGYQAMELLGTDGLCSFAQLKRRFGSDDGATGLRRIWDEVEGWLADPRKLFRSFSVEYLQRVVIEGDSYLHIYPLCNQQDSTTTIVSLIKMAPSHTTFKQSTLTGCFIQQASVKPATSTKSSTHRISKIPPPPPATKSKSKSKLVTASDRVTTDVLLAIKPVHLANIITRQKNHEYRKYRLRDEVTRLWLYETREGGQGRSSITHIAVIPASVRRTPGTVPAEPFGIGNDDFNAGRKQSKYGYPMLELYELVQPVTVAELKSRWGMGGAPMGWRYLTADLWQDRWGDDDQGRGDKVTRVF